ncbi:MAG: hypothetical protein GY795_20725 [Desulfobacterales bacterium]|nr:hypothetical protein [Desulfobacterales bacterium]
MRVTKKTLILTLIAALFIAASPLSAAAITADHNSATDFSNIPAGYFSQVRSNFSIYYGHTSHGSQIVTGMSMLEHENSSLYTQPPVYEDDPDLGYPEWEPKTRNHLAGNPGTNIVMWSWCGQLSDYSAEQVDEYLTKMSQLEADYPNVTFIYMTGHLDWEGPSGTFYTNNNHIRTYCTSNNKTLFDFADIESYDPDSNYYPDGTDRCEWCSEWCNSHECPTCDDCAHSQCFNCYRKGKAFWWLLTRLTGWDGQDDPPVPEISFYVQQTTGNDSNTGTDWGAGYALATIQKALSLASADTGAKNIHVAAGTYNENIELSSNITLLGGYPADGGTARNPGVNSTIIDGQGTNRVITISSVSNVTIDGFQIQNGNLSGRGGGIDIESSSSVTISGNTITDNTATGNWGGGIAVADSHVTITNNVIQNNHTGRSGGGASFYCQDSDMCSGTFSTNMVTNNSAYNGGGLILAEYPNLTVTGNNISNNSANLNGAGLVISSRLSSVISSNTISGNSAGNDGGGIFYNDSGSEISRNFIQNNKSGNWGGGICVYGSFGSIVNNVIYNNEAMTGGGISYHDNSLASVINNTIVDNRALEKGGGIGCYNNSAATVLNTILWGNTPGQLETESNSVIDVTYSNIQGGYSGNGVFSSDPLFASTNPYDFHLQSGSPCIGAGALTSKVPTDDIEGKIRPNPGGTAPDIGAFEFGETSGTVKINGTVITEDGTLLCAMVLANGQHMFTCEVPGEYELDVPLNDDGEIVLFSFCDGFAPFSKTMKPDEGADMTVTMSVASSGSTITLTKNFSTAVVNPGWVEISGTIMYGEIPLCAMVLANGQHVFSCDPDGAYKMEVPLNDDGEINLMGFCDGFLPYREDNLKP